MTSIHERIIAARSARADTGTEKPPAKPKAEAENKQDEKPAASSWDRAVDRINGRTESSAAQASPGVSVAAVGDMAIDSLPRGRARPWSDVIDKLASEGEQAPTV